MSLFDRFSRFDASELLGSGGSIELDASGRTGTLNKKKVNLAKVEAARALSQDYLKTIDYLMSRRVALMPLIQTEKTVIKGLETTLKSLTTKRNAVLSAATALEQAYKNDNPKALDAALTKYKSADSTYKDYMKQIKSQNISKKLPKHIAIRSQLENTVKRIDDSITKVRALITKLNDQMNQSS